MNFVSQAALIKDMDRELKLEPNLLRWVVLKRPFFRQSLEDLLADEEEVKAEA